LRAGVSSPLGAPLQGYLNRRHFDAGETVDLMAGGAGRARLVVERLLHGDPAPEGPGAQVERCDWSCPSLLELVERPVPYGSFVRIDDAAHLRTAASFSLALWCRPSRISGDWHAIAAKWSAADPGYGIFIAGAGILTAAVRGGDGRLVWCTAKEALRVGSWHHIALSVDERGGGFELHVTTDGLTSTTARACSLSHEPSRAPLLLGACASDAGRPEDARHHLDGRLARPLLLSGASQAARARALAAGMTPSANMLLGRWCFEEDVGGERVADRSPYAHHGVAVNAPARAVTGPEWTGRPARRFVDAPGDYDAIHLHSDDLDDASWPSVARVTVPAEARGGIYALRLENDRDEVAFPFVVRGRSRAPLVVLAPTLTWRAYASNRRPYTHSDGGVLDGGLGLYDLHADGTPATLTSLLRPTRSLQPSSRIPAWGVHLVTATLYLIEWLERSGMPYELLADEQLDGEGAAALEECRCLLLPGHSEYATAAMLGALEGYLLSGGRLAYLGGNGLYWVTSIDRRRPHLIEVRKSGEGDFDDDATPPPGEMQHQTDLATGGLWTRRGLPPSRLLGVDLAAHCHVASAGTRGFRRLPVSFDEAHAWIFEGVEGDTFGQAGLNLGSAAGYEMDAVPEAVPGGVLASTTVVASATDPDFYGTRHVPVEPRCDIALSTVEGGGAVFAAGSVTWTGSLAVDADVAQVTRNVIERFLSASPSVRTKDAVL
jgi:N,N-dimethylformamidase